MNEEDLKRRKQTLLELMNDPMYLPMKLKELAIFLDIPRERRYELEEVLEALLSEGSIRVSAKGRYGKPDRRSLVGTYIGNRGGFGFVSVEGMDSDIFIPEGRELAAMHGDRVRIIVDREQGARRAEGHVEEIIQHVNTSIVGYYSKNKKFGFVLPDNQKLTRDIYIPEGMDMGAVNGHKVVAEITDFGSDKKNPEGRITGIIGHINEAGTDISSIIKVYGLDEEFPDNLKPELEKIPDTVSDEAAEGRLDLRKITTVTIDGEDAKDLDDAISLNREGAIWTLGVHIADVSEYVRENTELDREAQKRGTSVYLPDRVIPMLPRRLSNGICSLNEGEDRLALSCIMEIDKNGRLLGHRIAETVINVRHRMTYSDVDAIISRNDEALSEKYSDCIELFMNMKELSLLIRNRRKERGSIDFDLPESRIVLDKKGKAVDIKPYERNAATRLIEDFMLMANETVAEDYFWQEIPFIYRVHDKPDEEKLKSLAAFINNFGFRIRTKNGDVHSKEIQKLLVSIEGSEAELLISRITLRSMKQARYQTECSGHYGLAAKYYTHFTSPIRRYPDLQIHRIIKENLKKGISERRNEHYRSVLDGIAAQSSSLERRADEIEREAVKYKKCEYMQSRIGEEFDGIISGISSYGMYVELPNTVEGFIRLADLRDDYYNYFEDSYELIGERSGRSYRIGGKIRIRVEAVDRLTRTIDFMPV